MRLYKRPTNHIAIVDFKSAKKKLKRNKVEIKLVPFDLYTMTIYKHECVKKKKRKQIKIPFNFSKKFGLIFGVTIFSLSLIAVIWFIIYENRPEIPIDEAVYNMNYICEEVTDMVSLNDRNATVYLIGKDGETVNDNFIQYMEFSTNTYAGAYYQSQKITLKEMAQLSDSKFTEKEKEHKNNVRYTINFEDGTKYELIVEGKRLVYLITTTEEFEDGFEKILTNIKMEK